MTSASARISSVAELALMFESAPITASAVVGVRSLISVSLASEMKCRMVDTISASGWRHCNLHLKALPQCPTAQQRASCGDIADAAEVSEMDHSLKEGPPSSGGSDVLGCSRDVESVGWNSPVAAELVSLASADDSTTASSFPSLADGAGPDIRAHSYGSVPKNIPVIEPSSVDDTDRNFFAEPMIPITDASPGLHWDCLLSFNALSPSSAAVPIIEKASNRTDPTVCGSVDATMPRRELTPASDLDPLTCEASVPIIAREVMCEDIGTCGDTGIAL